MPTLLCSRKCSRRNVAAAAVIVVTVLGNVTATGARAALYSDLHRGPAARGNKQSGRINGKANRFSSSLFPGLGKEDRRGCYQPTC